MSLSRYSIYRTYYHHICLLIFIEVRSVKEALGQNNLSISSELDVDFVSSIEWLQQETNRVVSSTLPFSYAKCLFSLTYTGEEIVNMKDKETIRFFMLCLNVFCSPLWDLIIPIKHVKYIEVYEESPKKVYPCTINFQAL